MSRRSSKARPAPAAEPPVRVEYLAESCPEPALEATQEANVLPLTAGSPAGKELRSYPSLYDSTTTTMAAILFGLFVIVGLQVILHKIARSALTEHVFLTRFVTSLVALVVGAYIADTLIAGPGTALLSSEERTLVLHFVKDTCLMVFAYYFGLKAPVPPPDGPVSK